MKADGLEILKSRKIGKTFEFLESFRLVNLLLLVEVKNGKFWF